MHAGGCVALCGGDAIQRRSLVGWVCPTQLDARRVFNLKHEHAEVGQDRRGVSIELGDVSC